MSQIPSIISDYSASDAGDIARLECSYGSRDWLVVGHTALVDAEAH